MKIMMRNKTWRQIHTFQWQPQGLKVNKPMNLTKVTGCIVLSRTRSLQSVRDPIQDNRNFYSEWHTISLAFIDKDLGVDWPLV